MADNDLPETGRPAPTPQRRPRQDVRAQVPKSRYSTNEIRASGPAGFSTRTTYAKYIPGR